MLDLIKRWWPILVQILGLLGIGQAAAQYGATIATGGGLTNLAGSGLMGAGGLAAIFAGRRFGGDAPVAPDWQTALDQVDQLERWAVTDCPDLLDDVSKLRTGILAHATEAHSHE